MRQSLGVTHCYSSEKSLVEDLCSALRSKDNPWGEVRLHKEFHYARGRTDIIAVDKLGNVIAFEAKLKKWAKAMQQAYRNTCFAHTSYVVFPEPTAKRADLGRAQFTRRSIGICSIKNGELRVLLPAIHKAPIQPQLSRIALAKAHGDAEQ